MKSLETLSSQCYRVSPTGSRSSSPGSHHNNPTIFRTLHHQSALKRHLMNLPRSPQQQQQSHQAHQRPGRIQRTMSLPAKLDQAPRTQKLFWFRPVMLFDDDKEIDDIENRRRAHVSSRRKEGRKIMPREERERDDGHNDSFVPYPGSVLLEASYGNDATCDGNNNGDLPDDLVGLGILADE